MIPDRALDLQSALTSAPNGMRFGVVPIDFEPLAFVRAGSERFEGVFYFSSPEGQAAGGLGIAAHASASGVGRFAAVRSMVDGWSIPEQFRVFTGFSFAADGPRSEPWKAFGASDAVLPIATAIRRDDECLLLLALPPHADVSEIASSLESLRAPQDPPYPNLGDHTLESCPPVSEWTSAVAEAVDAIHDGALRKVVLARSVVVRSDHAPDGFDLVSHLERLYRQCFGFGWRVNGATFVGASPELLVRLDRGVVTSNPLAGSARRGEGEAEDRLLAEELMHSEKDRIEHRFVVEDVADRLEPFVTVLDVPKHPSLRRMATVQHLSTQISGTAHDGTHVLDLVGALHPTPAVGGTSRDAAQAFIEKAEGFDRGWYAGGLGWFDREGEGEFAINLRCGLLEGTRAHVFAGAGIVEDSRPELELNETRLKLRPMLELLAAT
jgi:isochorismate synthase